MLTERPRTLALCGISLVAFGLLAWQLTFDLSLAATVDPRITAWLAERRTHAVTVLMQAVSAVHSTIGIDVMLGLMASYVALKGKRWREALWLVAAVQSSMLLNVCMKFAFARQRPAFDEPLVQLSTFSFPSGHALASTVLWGCVWLLMPTRIGKGIAGAIFAIVVVVVCVSRVYLGAHYFTDVVAGLLEGLFCVAAWSFALPADLRGRGRVETHLPQGGT